MKNQLVMVVLFFIALLSPCYGEELHLSGKTMGTHYSVKFQYSSQQMSKDEIQQAIDAKLNEVNQQMSTYRKDSEISRFNQSREINQPFPVSQGTLTVVREAIRINQLTDNGLDITLFPLVNLWGFGPQIREQKVPTESEIKEHLTWVGLDKLSLTEQGLVKSVAQLSLDLSAIAKGYGVDVIAKYLESLNIHDYLVDIGGEIRVKGYNQKGERWRIAIEVPSTTERKVQRIIALDNQSVATSGNYRNFFTVDGKRYSHTINPKTGYPIENDIASITVLAPNCMMADGFATGLGTLGSERALALADKQNLAIFIIIHNGKGFEERYSKAFSRYLTE